MKQQLNLEKLNLEVLELKKQMNKVVNFISNEREFVRETEEAWQEIDEGRYIKHDSPEDFFNSLKNGN